MTGRLPHGHGDHPVHPRLPGTPNHRFHFLRRKPVKMDVGVDQLDGRVHAERSRVSASLFILRIRFTGPSEIGERFVSIHQLFLRLFQYMNYLLIRNSPRLTIHPGINFNLQY